MIRNLDCLGDDRFMQRYVDRYCYFGGSTKQNQNQQTQSTSSNTIDPTQLALLTNNYAGAQSRAATLQPYSGALTAGFNPTQTQAQGVLAGIATDPTYGNTNNAAIGAVQGVLGTPTNTNVTAPTVNASTVSAPTTVTAGSLADTNLSPYMNPFTSSVIDSTINQNNRARQIANVGDNQAATAAGAFGGSRSGVANALTNEAYDRNNLSAIAGLNSDNFTQAQAAATGDINRNLSADEFNSTAGTNAGEFNATNTQNASNANASNSLTAQQASINAALAAKGLQLNAAGQLVSLNGAALSTAAQQGGILASVGDAQQQQQQTEITNALNAYYQGQQLTLAQQQLLNSALGLIPNQQTITSNGTSNGTSTTTSNPGLGGILSSLGSIAQGAAMFA